MGYGSVSDSGYARAAAAAFRYNRDVFDSGDLKPHPSLDPYGLGYRESRDSGEHPQSTPIAIWLDVTGSNIHQARIVHRQLRNFMGLLLNQQYVTDPQVMFSAVGDATCDRVPLQVGQFESDNRMDETLGNLVLEGGGGGQKYESYQNAFYVMTRHVATDAWEKRGKKGHLYVVGDEMSWPHLRKTEITRLIGAELEVDIELQYVIAAVRQRWHTTFIRPQLSSYGKDPEIERFWRTYLGEGFVTIRDAEEIVPYIAADVGNREGVPLNQIASDLAAAGYGRDTVSLVRATVGSREIAIN
jgi:hypothetical protein